MNIICNKTSIICLVGENMKICALAVKISKNEKNENIKFRIETEIIKQINNGVLYFMLALYSENDILLAEKVIEIRKKHSNIYIFAVMPGFYYLSGQTNKYKNRINNIVSQCTAVEKVMFTDEKHWVKAADEILIKNSQVIIIITDIPLPHKSWIELAADLYCKEKVIIKV